MKLSKIYEFTPEVSVYEGKDGIIREIECGLVMDIPIAKTLRDWLDDKIKAYEELEIDL